ncbi:hypothetical protein SLS60_008536 [Paraconiothyrium brasiliense]|uniref:C2H2-type domain-containing protein n=1 Tax=Paraconiothyrium brasiliense TaxID=300254 RepID=A0ABR3R1F2_9PLEO
MYRMHRRIWLCHLDKDSFTEKSAYENHVRAVHPDKASILLTPELISFRETTTKNCDRACPVCLKGFTRTLDLQKHLACHLESVALLSLPPEDQATDESGSHAGTLDQSHKAERRHHMVSRSIVNDFPEAGGGPPTFDENAHSHEAASPDDAGLKLTSESLMNILEESESGSSKKEDALKHLNTSLWLHAQVRTVPVDQESMDQPLEQQQRDVFQGLEQVPTTPTMESATNLRQTEGPKMGWQAKVCHCVSCERYLTDVSFTA